MLSLAVLLNGATLAFAVTGDAVAALVTAGLTTLNTFLLLWGQHRIKVKIDSVGSTADNVQGIVDRRRLQLQHPDNPERRKDDDA